jgi:apoptotic chromatin condensation inducer in the nucleus
MVTVDEAKNMIVVDLKEELKKRGASVQGKKAELLDRLLSLIDLEHAESDPGTTEINGSENVMVPDESKNDVKTVEAVPQSLQPMILCESKDLSSYSQKNDQEKLSEASKEPEADMIAEANVIIEPAVSEPAFVTDAKMQSGAEVKEIEKSSSEPKQESVQSDINDVLPLNEKIRQNIKKRKEKDDSFSTDASKNTADNKASHVRIDYFQRPLIVKNLVKWLSDTTGIQISEENVWINSIKTHCYIDFSSTRDGEICIQKVTGLKYPDSSTSNLSAHFTNISAKEAPVSAEAAMKPGEWLKVSKPSKTVDNSEPADGSILGKRKSEENKIVGGNLFKRATANALQQQIPVVNTSPRNVQVPVGSHFAKELSAEKNTSKITKLQAPVAQYPIESDLSLENLFRKTKAVPAIYWLPVEKHIAERRQNIYNRLGGRK